MLKIISTVLAVSLGSLAMVQAQQPQIEPGAIKINNVAVNILDTPTFSVRGTSKRVPRSKQWIEIETEFETALPYIPELTFKYFVAIDGENTQAVLTGSVTHISITEGSEKVKYSSMYIAPQTIAAVLQGRSSFRPDLVDQATVQIFYQGQQLAEASANPRPEGPWWTSLRQMDGLLLKKNETPFAPLWWDRYEVIKTSD